MVSEDRVGWKVDFFSFLTSLASGGMMNWLGFIVVEIDCGGIVAIARSMGEL